MIISLFTKSNRLLNENSNYQKEKDDLSRLNEENTILNNHLNYQKRKNDLSQLNEEDDIIKKQIILKKLFYEFPNEEEAFDNYIEILFETIEENDQVDEYINEIDNVFEAYILNSDMINYNKINEYRKRLEVIFEKKRDDYKNNYIKIKDKMLSDYNDFFEELINNEKFSNSLLLKKLDSYNDLEIMNDKEFLDNADKIKLQIIKNKIEKAFITFEAKANKYEKDENNKQLLEELKKYYTIFCKSENKFDANKILSEALLCEQKIEFLTLNDEMKSKYLEIKDSFEKASEDLFGKFEEEKVLNYNKDVIIRIKQLDKAFHKDSKKYQKEEKEIVNLFKKTAVNKINQSYLLTEAATYYSTIYSKIFNEIKNDNKYAITKFIISSKKDKI